ncbi:hypothetical protein BGZ49_000976 [Haplosporangium sp. Z 27]|nr:hypothetical protein BGZ49_000976 [Haplosporangium sp. Z 27]
MAHVLTSYKLIYSIPVLTQLKTATDAQPLGEKSAAVTEAGANSSRRPLASQHPLANVSTFDSDRDSIATDILEGAEIFSNTTQAQLHSSKDSLGDRASISSCRSSIPTTGLPRPLDSKQNDLSALKSAIRSGSSQVYVISTKPESSSSTNIPQQADSHDGLASMETEWNGFTVGSGVDQPISPLTVLSPNIPSYSLMTSEQPSERQSSPPSNTSSTAPAVPSPRQESEKWAPPPRSSRRLQESSRQESTLPPPHSRLPIPKLLKQRSFNFSFTSPSTGASSMQSTMRASMDESSSPTEHGSTSQLTRTTASCDIPRPIGPPDPIPPHYQHLQNRSSRITSFRRRSHGGELDRFPAGWTVSENAASVQATPSASASDVQFPDASRPNIPRRHASLGTHSNSTSMWGRLLTSIFPSSGSENGERDIPRRSSDGGIPDLYSQPQLLLLSSSGQQGQGPQQLSQQQLFFYADEVVDRLERSDSDYSCLQDDEAFGPRYSSEDSSGEDAPSFFQGSLTADANLQGELAQEDRRESVELMTGDTMFVRPDAPSQLIGDGFIVPRALSVDGKIPTSCLALSSPPSYWEAAVKYNGWPKIDARPEQGQESLPRYTCSVFREGCVNRKTELVGEWRPYRRPWKRTFAHLRGTSLRLYAVDAEDVPRLHVRNISLQLAKCEMATDYKQRPNVIRIRASDRTVLVECKDRIDALTWLEHLQAAANIATSLEERAMPKFHTLPRAPNHPSSGSGSRTNSNSSSSVSNRQQSSNASLQHQEEGQNSEQQRQEQQLQIQQQQQQQQQIEQQQLRQRQVERQQQQQQYLQQLQAQQEQERQYLQQQEEERQELQRQQRQRQMSMERAPRPQINERQMSMERTPRPSQRLRQPSIDQTPPQANLNPFQQLQQVLQSQQEHILKIQCRVQRQQRAQQLVVQSNESSSVLPPTLGDHSEAALSSSPPSSTSSSSSRRSDGRSAFGRLQNQSRSKSRSPPQSPPLSPPASQRARTSLMTRAERERVMTEGDRRRETAMAGEFEMMRTVLHELGHSSDSDSSINDSDEAGEDDDVMGINGPSSNRRRRTTTSASFNGHSSSAARANSQHSRVQSNQEDGGARSAANRESSGGQDWERTRFACAQQQQQLQLLQEYHEQQQLQQQQQQQQRRQRASWNKRFFSNLWGQNDHSSGHGHGQIAHPSLSLATST